MARDGRRRFAVVMGDLIASEKAASRTALHTAFNTAVEEANRGHAHHIASPLTITLGDEFQGLVTSLAAGFRLIHALRLDLLGRDVPCRFVLGAVELETPLNPDRAWNMMGPGLAAARERLDDKTAPGAYRFSFPAASDVEPLLNGLGETLTFLERDWTATQRGYMLAHLGEGLSVAEIARRQEVSERAVYKGLSAANGDFYQRQLATLQGYFAARDERGEEE